MTFYSLISPYRSKIILVLFFILTANLLSLALPWGIKMIIDDVLIRGDTRLLAVIVLVLTGLLILQMGFNFVRKMTGNVIGERIVCDLREKICWQIHKMSLSSIRTMTAPQILTRITGDVENIRRFIFNDAIESIYAVLSLGLITAVLLWINLRLTLVALLALPLFALMYFRFVPRLKDGYQRARDVNGRLAARINEVLNGIAVVRVFTAEDREKERFSQQQKEMFHVAKGNHALNAGLWTGIDFFTSLGVLAVLWIGGMDVIHHRMTPGGLIAFYSYLGMLFSPLVRLVVINSSFQEANASLNRMNEIMETAGDVPQARSPLVLEQVKGRIEFRNVTFGYSSQEDVLKDITFSVQPGETVGIVGPSGAGKTTLMNLMVRFFDPQKGEILIDGHDLRGLDLTAYRRHLAVVLQDDYLFSGTVRDNILYGNPRASRQEMEEAVQAARADGFIHELTEGYETQTGERGTQFSGGQRQRIAIARAVVRRPAVLILDEATCAVDAMTENEIQKAVCQKMKGRTVFIVAHRFSTIMEADKILVLDGGRIVEFGDHSYLLKKKGFYSNLYLEQFKEDSRYFTAESV